jgi:excisionase family DNA binding protein
MRHIKDVLQEILENIKQQDKCIYTFQEGCNYCGISASFMYKQTSKGNIKFYKPEGKLIYFRKEDLETWMLRNPQSTNEEQQDIANAYTFNRNKSKS